MPTTQPADPALDLVCKFAEPFEGFNSKPYPDPGGVWTEGFGQTFLPNGDPVRKTTPPVSRIQAAAQLRSTMARCLHTVDALVTVPLGVAQAAALADFEYNEGAGALERSTLLRLLNRGDYTGAAAQFLVWDKERLNGVLTTSEGLARRRKAEQALFLSNDADIS